MTEPTPAPVRVVLADDHPMYRFGLRAVLDASPEVEVVGEAADGAEQGGEHQADREQWGSHGSTVAAGRSRAPGSAGPGDGNSPGEPGEFPIHAGAGSPMMMR